MSRSSSRKKHPGGRPRKFAESSKPITITLPLRILQQLTSVDADRAKAITKVTDAAVRLGGEKGPKVELVEVLPGKAIILVGPSKRLQEIPFLNLAEIAPTRYMLILPSGTAIESLEVAIADILDDGASDEPWERDLLVELQAVMKELRRGKKVNKAEMLFVDYPLAASNSASYR